jgi:hypothetical protein
LNEGALSWVFVSVVASASCPVCAAGVRGAHITVGRTTRVTLGIPGSGISWTETMEHGRRAPQGAPQPVQPRSGLGILGWVAFLIFVLVAIIGGGGH